MKRLEWLTVFRFFAALWVLAYHLAVRFPLPLPDPLRHFIANGPYAMSFFFVLSGTVLAYGYIDLAGNPREWVRFYTARLARVYPVYALTFLITLPWLGISPTNDWIRWAFVTVASILGNQAWFPHAFVGANTGLWSLSSEFFFYALFPLLLPLAKWLCTPANFPRAVIYLTLLIGFLGLADFAFARRGTFPIYYISPALRLPEFFLGMVLGAALRQRNTLLPVSVLHPFLAGIVVLIAGMNRVHEIGLCQRVNIIVVPAIAWLIYATARFELSRGDVPRHVAGRLFQYLGEISYCFFLAQLPLLIWFEESRSLGGPIARWAVSSPMLAWCLAGVIILLLSIALHEGVEKPVRRWMISRGSRAKSAT